jgi:hypothetical protein
MLLDVGYFKDATHSPTPLSANIWDALVEMLLISSDKEAHMAKCKDIVMTTDFMAGMPGHGQPGPKNLVLGLKMLTRQPGWAR